MPKLSIIIPCYYNEENIPVTADELIKNEAHFPKGVEFEYVLVDDGSKDGTLNTLLAFKQSYPDKVKVLKLAGNVGSYNAVVAGMEYATGDCNVIIAADMQDPLELMPKMMEHWEKGYKLVIGSRADRKESFAQKIFSNTFHYMMRKFALKNVPTGGFDYVFFDRQIKDEILKIKERNSNVAPDSFLTANYMKESWGDIGINISKMVLSAVSSETNKGWYIKLISEMTFHLKNEGSHVVFMNTQSTNRAVIKVWESLGYKFGMAKHILSKEFI